MKTRIVGQPFVSSPTLYDFLKDACNNEQFTRLRVAVAWAKRSGLVRISDPLRAFRNRGGHVIGIVGISEGGATRQGLELAADLFSESYVFHDAGRTFHPKCYIVEGENVADIFIGSNNLTAGGIYWNYELGLHLSLDLSDDSNLEIYSEISGWFDSLIDDSAVCKPLTPTLISNLLGSSRYQIGDEDLPRDRSPQNPQDGKNDSEASADVGDGESLFGKSKSQKRSDPASIKSSKGAGDKNINERSGIRITPENALNEDASSDTEAHIIYRWHKKLSASDALQPKTEKTKITGHLKLGQARHPIDQKVYFRYIFFANERWSSEPKGRGIMERATVSFEVFVGTTSHGIHNILIDYAEYRIADQNNTPTWLHWNKDLSAYLRSHNHVGDYITLEALTDGSYRLIIANDPAGPFIG